MQANQTPTEHELHPTEAADTTEEKCPDYGTSMMRTDGEQWCVVCAAPVTDDDGRGAGP